MWFKEPEVEASKEVIKIKTLSSVALYISLAGTLIFGLYPDLFFNFFRFVIK
jgi:NADH:ubiquinone oxidoreductase subunit 2 (subunit N)